MFNPFDFEKDDARFVEAAHDVHEREMKIVRLTVSRNWLFVSLAMQLIFMIGILFLDWRQLMSNALFLLMFAGNLAAFNHTDLLIKFLKASK
jgi:hypothetical protein